MYSSGPSQFNRPMDYTLVTTRKTSRGIIAFMEIYYGIFWALMAMVCWGIADYSARTATIQSGSAICTSFYIHVIGLLIPAGILIYRANSGYYNEIDFVLLLSYGSIAGFLYTLNYVLYYRGLATGSVSVVTAVASAFAVVAVIFSAIFLEESFSLFQFGLIVVITFGIALTAFKDTSITGSSTGLMYAIACMLISGIAVCIIKPLVEEFGPTLAIIVPLFISSLFTGMWAIKMKAPLVLSYELGLKNVVIAGVLDSLGFLCLAIGFVLAPVFLVTPISAGSPLVTILMARVLIAERVSRIQSTGVIVTIAGVIILSGVTG